MLKENIKWDSSKWTEGKEDKKTYLYPAVPGSIQYIDQDTVSLVKKLITSKKALNGVVYEAKMDDSNVNIFTCNNSHNLHQVPTNGGWESYSNYTRAKPGDVCYVLPTREAGENLPGYKFILA